VTEQELQGLGRRELARQVLEQAKEEERLRAELAGAESRARELEDAFGQLREQLNEKDARLREMEDAYDLLRDQLDEKSAQLRELDEALQTEREDRLAGLNETGSIAEAALRLSGVFEAAQRAADLYLQKVRESGPPPAGAPAAAEPKEILMPPDQSPPPAVREKTQGDSKWKLVLSFGWEKE